MRNILLKVLLVILVFLFLAVISYRIIMYKNIAQDEDYVEVLKKDAKEMSSNLNSELSKLEGLIESGKDNVLINEDIFDKLDELAKETDEKRNEKLQEDVLKQGTSSGSKYSGIPCKDACW